MTVTSAAGYLFKKIKHMNTVLIDSLVLMLESCDPTEEFS